eukprot:Em0002g205a
MAKTDLERIGLFSETGYTTIGDPYVSTNSKPFNESASKGKQFITISTKPKTADMTGYFGKTFDRVMEGEALTDPIKIRRRQRMEETKKNLGKAWVPNSGEKKPSGTGSHYGTLSGPVEAFSALSKPKEMGGSPGKNFLTSPGKKGTGFGYTGITIGPLPKYASEPYDRAKELKKEEESKSKTLQKGAPFKLNLHPRDHFDDNPFHADKSVPPYKDPDVPKAKPKPFKPSSPSKRDGGCKAGTFDPYPSHSVDPYGRPKAGGTAAKKEVKKGPSFKPIPGPKSTPVRSTMEQSIYKKMNSTNFTSVTPSS